MKRPLLTLLWLLSLASLAAGDVRVVSQTTGCDEMLLGLAAPEQVAALSHLARDPAFTAVAEQAKAFPQLTPGGDAEGILRFRPTLVLFADYSRAELVAQVQRAGVRVLIFDHYRTLDESCENLRILARELGPDAVARAETLIRQAKARMARLEERLKGVKPVRVIAPSTYGVIAGTDTTFQDLCDHAGAENVAFTVGGLRGHAAPPSEGMLLWPIEQIVVSAFASDDPIKPFDTTPPYEFLEAVRKRRVARIEPYQLNSVTHYRIDGYEQLARALHPERFRDEKAPQVSSTPTPSLTH